MYVAYSCAERYLLSIFKLILFSDFNDPYPMKKKNHGEGGIKLKPLLSKINIIGTFMMVVLEQLTHHKEIQR